MVEQCHEPVVHARVLGDDYQHAIGRVRIRAEEVTVPVDEEVVVAGVHRQHDREGGHDRPPPGEVAIEIAAPPVVPSLAGGGGAYVRDPFVRNYLGAEGGTLAFFRLDYLLRSARR